MNVKLVRLLGTDQTVYPHQLEMLYPRLVDKIVDLWGTTQMEPFFSELMLDTRGGRQGFPPAVLMEIFALSNRYNSLKPARPRSIDNWGDTAELDRLERRSG
jgi:hypothetical protein